MTEAPPQLQHYHDWLRSKVEFLAIYSMHEHQPSYREANVLPRDGSFSSRHKLCATVYSHPQSLGNSPGHLSSAVSSQCHRIPTVPQSKQKVSDKMAFNKC